MPAQPFRQCRVCGKQWNTWQEFLVDPSLQVLGLQAVPKIPKANVLIFNHARCGTVSILTSKLHELVEVPDSAQPETEPCDGCFRDLDDLAGCDRPCVIAKDRRLTLKVLALKRGGGYA